GREVTADQSGTNYGDGEGTSFHGPSNMSRSAAGGRATRAPGPLKREVRRLTSPSEAWRDFITQGRGLLDHVVRPKQHRLWDGQPQSLRGSEIDHQLELRRLLDGQVGRLGALQDLVYVGGRPPEHVPNAGPVRQQAASLGGLNRCRHGRQ